MTERLPFRVYLYGRVHGLTRARLEALVLAAGGVLMRRPSARVDLVAVGHGTAAQALADGPSIILPRGLPDGVPVISERSLKRLLGLLPAQDQENRTFTSEGLAGTCRVDPALVRTLAAYDVLEPDGDAFGFSDLRTTREVSRLLAEGVALHEIVEAATVLRHSGRTLSDTRVREAPWGDLAQQFGSVLGSLDGQLALALEEPRATADEIFERAEECELNGDLIGAERWYRLAAKMERTDPVASFNLANVLDALGREQEAALAYQEAVARDPAFAEAWVNLGILHERRGAADAAKACYGRAIAACPESPEGLHNFALLLTRANSFTEAVPLWVRYIATNPPDSSRALRLLAFCRIGSNARAEASVCV